ncbi:hypothetical protein ABW20_dc0106900 [Dactylellina cionopaga]|nr:hypothetical protein ABW20_dc0106900 [Dactylellina cionopaga]
MVNVGGRSKGCSNCRRRRVKCDETRPICQRCQRCGFECDGPRDITFVEGTIVKSRRSERTTTLSAPARPVLKSGVVDAGPADRQVTLPAQLKPRGDEVEIYICYSRKNLRRGAAIDLVLEKTHPSEVVATGVTESDNKIFHQAILSFGTLLFGYQHHQANIISRGYALHGVALKHLNEALSDSKCYTRDEVILCVATFAILECLVPTGSKNFLKHMIGLERLLELRGPGSYCSPISGELYKSVRHMIIFASLRTGKPSILAKKEWEQCLRECCSEKEIQEQDLFDILADCTVLIAERNNMLTNWDLNLESCIRRRDKIERRALKLLAHLRGWKARWDSDETNVYTETPTSITGVELIQTSSDDNPPPLSFFKFSSDASAIMLMFYNTTCICVLNILTSLPFEIVNIDTGSSLAQDSPQEVEPKDKLEIPTRDQYATAEWLAALEVCRCIPYYSERSRRHSVADGSPIVHWAITTAWMTLARNEPAGGRRIMDQLDATCEGMVAKGVWQAGKS